MKRRQETTLARARERFDEATEGESTSKTRASFVSEPVRDLIIDGQLENQNKVKELFDSLEFV